MKLFPATLALLAFALPAFALPPVLCNARSYGAKADGKTNDGAAIQAAIDDCAKKDGGTVTLSGGVFLSSPIVLRSNITLNIRAGAMLLGSADHKDYAEITQFRTKGRQSLVSATNVENVRITGEGVIDGNGSSWWEAARSVKRAGDMGNEFTRPRLVVLDHVKHVVLEDITVQNSPMWQIVPYYSEDVVLRRVKVLAPSNSPNTDAIDPFSSKNIVIDHVYADVGDDNIAIKSGMPGSAGGDEPSRDIIITDCVFVHGHGLSIGSEIAGGVQNVRAERIEFRDTDNGIRIKSNRDRGGDIGNFFFKDIKMDGVKTAILITEYYPKIPDTDVIVPVGRLTPHFHDIHIENVKAQNSKSAGTIVGLPESPILNLTLVNVQIAAQTGMTIRNANIQTKGLIVKPQSGTPVAVGANVKGEIK
jgi:polygalacturonase